MKSDDQVLADAMAIVERQWCQGNWKVTAMGSKDRGWSPEPHYCAMGAVQKAAGTRVQGSVPNMEFQGVAKAKIEQVKRIAARLAATIEEQYPERDNSRLQRAEVVEIFNDDHTREEMLAIMEKTLA